MTDQRWTWATDDYVVTFDYDDSWKYLSCLEIAILTIIWPEV